MVLFYNSRIPFRIFACLGNRHRPQHRTDGSTSRRQHQQTLRSAVLSVSLTLLSVVYLVSQTAADATAPDNRTAPQRQTAADAVVCDSVVLVLWCLIVSCGQLLSVSVSVCVSVCCGLWSVLYGAASASAAVSSQQSRAASVVSDAVSVSLTLSLCL